MRVALVGKLRAIEPFPLSPFPFRDGGTKTEKPIVKTNSVGNSLKIRLLKIQRIFLRTPSPERGGGQGAGFLRRIFTCQR